MNKFPSRTPFFTVYPHFFFYFRTTLLRFLLVFQLTLTLFSTNQSINRSSPVDFLKRIYSFPHFQYYFLLFPILFLLLHYWFLLFLYTFLLFPSIFHKIPTLSQLFSSKLLLFLHGSNGRRPIYPPSGRSFSISWTFPLKISSTT